MRLVIELKRERSVSSRRSLISEIFLSRTRSAMRSIRFPLPPFFTMKGNSVTMIASLPWRKGSTCARPRITTRPRPVS